MNHANWLVAFSLTALAVSPASAQTAVRCDQAGQAAYSEKECPPGVAGRIVAPTQDSAAQKQAANDANAQLRKDSQAIDQRLTKRVKGETASRSAGKPPRTVADKSKSAKGDKGGAAKKKHKRKASAAKSSAAKPKAHDAVTREPKRTQS